MKRKSARPAVAAICSLALFCLFLYHSSAAGASSAAAGQQAAPQAPSTAAGLVLVGTVRGSQNQSYIKAPFEVPAGTERVTITFDYTGKEQHTSSRSRIARSRRASLLERRQQVHAHRRPDADATPSCLPGAIPPGTWNVLIGVPNIRANVESHYTIHVYLLAAPARWPASRRCCASRSRAGRLGFAAICTCTPRTAMANAPARRERWFPARSTSPPTPPRAAASTSSPSPTTTPARNTMRCASCNLTSTSCF